MTCVLCGSEALVMGAQAPLSSYFHCAHCDLRFLDPRLRLSPEDEHRRYLSHENHVTDPGYQEFVRPLVDAIESELHQPAQGLDFGAGPGPVVAHLLRQGGHQVACFDPYFWNAPEVLTRTYDFIAASEVVEHLYDPANEFRRLRTLLRPHGVLGLMTSMVDENTDFANWYYRRDPTHVVFYSQDTFRWIARAYGFRDVRFPHARVVLLG